MKKIEKRALSILTAIVMWNATNTYAFDITYIKPAIKMIENGKVIYVVKEGYYNSKDNTEVTKVHYNIESILRNESYLLEDNSYNYENKEAPKIKSRRIRH